MAVIFQGPMNEDGACERCHVPIAVGEDAFVLRGVIYCSLDCIEQGFAEDVEEGTDYTAARDQAMAAIKEQLGQGPKQFILLWEPTDPEGGDVGVTMFCHPSFVVHAVETLAHAMVDARPTVAPPD